MKRSEIGKAKRVVIKVGTALLTRAGVDLDERIIDDLVGQIADLMRGGVEVIIVTSGAISAGVGRLGLRARPKLLPELQAAAAVGQSVLIACYERCFGRHGHWVAQILLTHDDLRDRARHLNARNTINTLLALGVIPIINENDTVSVDEIKFGDNDMLSALVANLVKADLLVILSDIEGLMTADPKRSGAARLISEVSEITDEIISFAEGTGNSGGTGGMRSKLEAARIVTGAGETAVIADGREKNILARIFRGDDVGTLFLPSKEKMRGRKRWIAYFTRPRGEIHVDGGAADALCTKGKSLLASGVISVEGDFHAGDTVRIAGRSGREIGRGLVNYTSGELKKIMGKKTGQIEAVLGYKYYDEVVHRDNLVIFTK